LKPWRLETCGRVPLSQCKNLKKTDCKDGKIKKEILVFLKNPPFLRDYEE
jgi:hypothetical protein